MPFGVLLLTPDTLFMRLSELEKWQLGGWRGVLMGATLFFIWFFKKMGHKSEFLNIFYSWTAIIVAMAVNSVSFTLGISETSVIVVLTALATMPL